MEMKKLIIIFLLGSFCISTLKAQNKLSKEERAKLTQEQRIIYDNSFKKKGKGKVTSVKKKAKLARKEDKLSRKIKPPKKRKVKKR
jgi:hypothetical protein